MLDILDNDIYEINANGDPSTVTFGADNGLTLADLKGVTDLDDERWSLLMDQLTLEEGMIRLGLGGTSTKAIESIMSPETIQNDGPNGIYSYPLGQYANTDKTSADPAPWMPTTQPRIQVRHNGQRDRHCPDLQQRPRQRVRQDLRQLQPVEQT